MAGKAHNRLILSFVEKKVVKVYKLAKMKFDGLVSENMLGDF